MGAAGHDAARLASGFFVALTLWFTWLASGKRIAAALLLAGSLGYLQHAHQFITDNALVAGIAIGVCGLARSNGLLLGTGAGIAFLSKGLLGPGMLALSALALFAFPAWRTRRYAISLGWAALAFAPWALIWPALLYFRSQGAVRRVVLGQQLRPLQRQRRPGRRAGPLALPQGAALVRAFRPCRLRPGQSGARCAPGPSSATRPCRCRWPCFVVMLAVLSAASSARTLYGLPMLVPLAMLGALSLDSLPERLRGALEHTGFWGGIAMVVVRWGAWLFLLLGWPARSAARLAAFSPGHVPHVAAVPFLFAVAVTAGWLFVLLVASDDRCACRSSGSRQLPPAGDWR